MLSTAPTVIRIHSSSWKAGRSKSWNSAADNSCMRSHMMRSTMAPRSRLNTGSSKGITARSNAFRSEEHTSELQSRFDLVCRLLLEKKKKKGLQIQLDRLI